MLLRAVALVLAGATLLRALDMSQCIAPLGMESGLIPDKDISASSCYNDGNVAPQNGRLNQDIKGGAWCPRSQITTESTEWLEVDLRAVHVLTAVGSQGRFGNGQGQEFAEAYLLEYWRPRLGKWVRYRSRDGKEVLTGNTNTYLEQKNRLRPAIWASKVRFLPHSTHRRTVCMRVELYGCLWTAGIVSYSMPAGDARSNGVELSDATYDGTWSGGELRGGLGQLVDGEFGGDEIREAERASAWVGWRNDSRAPDLTFEFERAREFRALHIHCNNRFMRDVRLFAEAVVSFSVGGRRYQEDAVRLAPPPDDIFESARNVTVPLHRRIGRFVRLRLRFAARWILVSEVVFESEVARGNHSAEAARAPAAAPAPAPAAPPVPTARAQDPLYVAVAVGVLTALAILVAVAVLLLVHRHRHRKCFASPLGAGAPPPEPPPDKPRAPAAAPDDYQEPYQALKCGPYFSYGTVLLEMNHFAADSTPALSADSSNYEYAVPELSSAPLLAERRAPVDSLEALSSRDRDSLAFKRSTTSLSLSLSQEEAVSEVRRRLAGGAGAVPELPTHRLRMISKLAEGAFGTVYVAEADGVPDYEGTVCDKQLVAVKFLSQDASLAERKEFEHDVRILSSLSHPCLARVVGLCRPLAVVLEYLPGGDLCAFLRTASPAPAPRARLRLAAHLAAGMAYLETLNFVHRDLAARNCLVGPGYQLKICDFGTDSEAYAADYYRGAGGAGEPLPLRWAAWEAALCREHSTRADVWAFAVTLHEIYTLCRRRPYHRMTDHQVLENLSHLRADDGQFECLERATSCPRDVYELMTACWRRDARARPSFRDAHAFLQRRTAS